MREIFGGGTLGVGKSVLGLRQGGFFYSLNVRIQRRATVWPVRWNEWLGKLLMVDKGILIGVLKRF
jgi:hypothetical protein